MSILAKIKSFFKDNTLQLEFPFKTRDAYLKWVIEWKAEYKKLSDEQRELKKEMRKPHIISELKGYGMIFRTSSASGIQASHYYNKFKLNELLNARTEGKKASWKMKHAAE